MDSRFHMAAMIGKLYKQASKQAKHVRKKAINQQWKLYCIGSLSYVVGL